MNLPNGTFRVISFIVIIMISNEIVAFNKNSIKRHAFVDYSKNRISIEDRSLVRREICRKSLNFWNANLEWIAFFVSFKILFAIYLMIRPICPELLFMIFVMGVPTIGRMLTTFSRMTIGPISNWNDLD